MVAEQIKNQVLKHLKSAKKLVVFSTPNVHLKICKLSSHVTFLLELKLTLPSPRRLTWMEVLPWLYQNLVKKKHVNPGIANKRCAYLMYTEIFPKMFFTFPPSCMANLCIKSSFFLSTENLYVSRIHFWAPPSPDTFFFTVRSRTCWNSCGIFFLKQKMKS